MASARRGEIEAELGNRTWRMVLTLGALAELEDSFGASDLTDLAERFAGGQLRSADLIRIIGCGLRGAGNEISDAEVGRLTSADGLTGYVSIVAALLLATSGPCEPQEARPFVAKPPSPSPGMKP
jgi:hypothetical protein